MSASTWLSCLLGRSVRSGGRRVPRRPGCRPRVENLEGRLTPSFGSVLYSFAAPSPEVNEHFGASVAVAGESVAVGAPGATASGLAARGDFAHYTLTPQGPFLRPHTPVSGGEANDNLGASVAVSGDWVAVGEPNRINPGGFFPGTGGVAVYKNGVLQDTLLSTTWGEHFGSSVAVWGNYLVVGAPDYPIGGAASVGQAYLYNLSTMKQLAALTNVHPVPNGRFGASVAIAGTTVLVGFPGDTNMKAEAIGSVTVFDITDVNHVTSYSIVSPEPAPNEQFGASVSLSLSNGSYLALIGAPGNGKTGVNAGSAYLMDLGTYTWRLKLYDPARHAWDGFGWSVAIAGNTVLVGAPGDSTKAVAAGRAYLFDAAAATTSPRLTLDNPFPHAWDGFGSAVAVPVSGKYAVVGAPFDDTGATDAGAAYVFDLRPNPPPGPEPEPGPQPVPAAPAVRPIAALLRRVRKGHRRVWQVEVYVAGTGQPLARFRCPYQEPTYRRIRLQTADANHDGLADTVVLKARRGRRTVSRAYDMV
jgi:hypothetical protein